MTVKATTNHLIHFAKSQEVLLIETPKPLDSAFSSLRKTESARFVWLDESALKAAEQDLFQVKKSAKRATLVSTIVIAVFVLLAAAAAIAAILMIPGLNILAINAASIAFSLVGLTASLLITFVYNKSRQERTLADQIQKGTTYAPVDQRPAEQLFSSIEDHCLRNFDQELRRILQADDRFLDALIKGEKPNLENALQQLPPKTDLELFESFAKGYDFSLAALLDSGTFQRLRDDLKEAYAKGVILEPTEEWFQEVGDLSESMQPLFTVFAALLETLPDTMRGLFNGQSLEALLGQAIPLFIKGLIEGKTVEELLAEETITQALQEDFKASFGPFLTNFKTLASAYAQYVNLAAVQETPPSADLALAFLQNGLSSPAVQAALLPGIDLDGMTQSFITTFANDVASGLGEKAAALKPLVLESLFDGSLNNGTIYDKPAIQALIEELAHVDQRQNADLVLEAYFGSIKESHDLEALRATEAPMQALKDLFAANAAKGLGLNFARFYQNDKLNLIITPFILETKILQTRTA